MHPVLHPQPAVPRFPRIQAASSLAINKRMATCRGPLVSRMGTKVMLLQVDTFIAMDYK